MSVTGPGAGGDVDGLSILGLRSGEEVRWRPASGGRWRAGTVSHRERDGSIGVRDYDGAARSLPVEAIRVGRAGPRGGLRWEPLTARAGRCEQLTLWDLREPLRRSARAASARSAGRARRGAARREQGS